MTDNSQIKTLHKAPFDSDREVIEDLINQGWSDSQIAKKYDVIPYTIWHRRKRWGLPSGNEARKKITERNITTYWQNGYTVEEISELLGISLQVVYSLMREYKIRELPRMGIDAPAMSFTELRQAVNTEDIDDETVIMVTHNRLPKWVLVPIEQYQDLTTGVYDTLRTGDSK